MRYGIVVSLAILIGTRGASALQDNPESAILSRAATAIQLFLGVSRLDFAYPRVAPSELSAHGVDVD
jgi:hypothetical protein